MEVRATNCAGALGLLSDQLLGLFKEISLEDAFGKVIAPKTE